MHRNKYIEGSRRVRERPVFSYRSLWLLIVMSGVGYLVFWYFVADIDGSDADGTGIAGQLITSLLLIGGVILAGIVVGSVIALLNRSRRKTSWMDHLPNQAEKPTEPQD